MRASHLLLFLLTIPFLAAVAHDIYLFITNGGSVEVLQQSLETTMNDIGEPGVKSLLASLGFIWTHYEPDSYKWTVENMDEKTWAIINLILAQKAVFVTGALAASAFLIAFICKLVFGSGDTVVSGGGSRSRIDKVLNPNKKAGKFKYKRK